jgi:hypothetical protein
MFRMAAPLRRRPSFARSCIMKSEVSVSFGAQAQHRFDLDEAQPMPHEVARAWLDEQFQAFECEPVRATGKVLTADKVMAVAQGAGVNYFSAPEHREWAMTFARAACAALSKPVVRIDLDAMTIGF